MATPVPFLPLALGHLHLIVIWTQLGNIQHFPAGQGLTLLSGDRRSQDSAAVQPLSRPKHRSRKTVVPKNRRSCEWGPCTAGSPL